MSGPSPTPEQIRAAEILFDQAEPRAGVRSEHHPFERWLEQTQRHFLAAVNAG
ncbi:hypothetical protein KIKIMORA_00950 [Brevundimonas phage vB_BpoS-Kikimora]|uniref:Uncharacterized protein n=1 Tax=Brevundimonas phage vB_BpoS-Kikimora TaxID=2948601 RepID=A0A9E7MQY4_9CAUD|nr:hypothetical protein KIKIMORA_00950 [Brevundimonas phage vB_BpoS-Kikimora]